MKVYCGNNLTASFEGYLHINLEDLPLTVVPTLPLISSLNLLCSSPFDLDPVIDYNSIRIHIIVFTKKYLYEPIMYESFFGETIEIYFEICCILYGTPPTSSSFLSLIM